MHRIADTVLVVHAMFVFFVVGGAFYVWIGALLRWPGVRNRRFRLFHLAAILFVALQSILGYACPLTVWEDRLRGAAGEPAFVARWLRRAIYYDFPDWLFTLAYVAFALALAFTWRAIPPHARKNYDQPEKSARVEMTATSSRNDLRRRPDSRPTPRDD